MNVSTGSKDDDANCHESFQIFGREEELRELINLPSTTTMIVGDRGIGKSYTLRALMHRIPQQYSSRALISTPEPRQIKFRPGSLQIELMRSLEDIMASHISPASYIAHWRSVLSLAAQRATDARTRDMVATAGTYLLGVVRARAGEEIADGVEALARELSKSTSEQLTERLAAQTDPDALEAFVLLAAEVCRTLRVHIAIGLDNFERLSEDDFRLFLDLVQSMPVGVNIVGTHATSSAPEQDRVQQLGRLTGYDGKPLVCKTNLGKLSPAAVDEWLYSAGIAAPSSTPDTPIDIMSVTGGYPLYVDVAISRLRTGETPKALRINEAFADNMRSSYAALGSIDQEAVGLLAAFTHRPELDEICRMLEISPRAWAAQEQRLDASRIFAVTENGAPWFHEIARRAIWEEVLSPSQRIYNAREALSHLTDHESHNIGWTMQECVDIAKLATEDQCFSRENAGVKEILETSNAGLSVLASLLELTEKGNDVLPLDLVLMHARNRFHLQSSGYDAVMEVEGLGLVVFKENSSAGVVGAFWRSAIARVVAIGHISTSLGRFPIPEMATDVLESVVRPLVEPFDVCMMGVGLKSITEASNELRGIGRRFAKDDSPTLSPFGIILYARLGNVDFYFLITYDSDGVRDATLKRLFDDANRETPEDLMANRGRERYGQPLELLLLESLPRENPLPSLRFENALEYLRDCGMISGTSSLKKGPYGAEDIVEHLESRVREIAAIREYVGDLDRYVLGIERTRGYIVGFSDNRAVIIEVHGCSEVVEITLPNGKGRFAEFNRMKHDLLSPSQFIGTIIEIGDVARYQARSFIEECGRRIDDFNRAQNADLLEVPLNGQSLTRLIGLAHDGVLQDAQVLGCIFVGESEIRVEKASLYVLISEPNATSEGSVLLETGLVYSMTVYGTREHGVHVKLLSPSEFDTLKSFDTYSKDVFEAHFSIAEGATWVIWHSQVSSGIARMLGFDTVLLISS